MKTTQKTMVKDYFYEVDLQLDSLQGKLYYQFLKMWALKRENSLDSEYVQVVYRFVEKKLHRVQVITCGEVIREYSRDRWLYFAEDLDSRHGSGEDDFNVEYLPNEDRLADCLSTSVYSTPITENEFLISIFIAGNNV